MRKYNRYIIALSVIIIFVIAWLWAIQRQGSHNFEGRCNLCHVGMKDPSILTRNVDQLCLSCHEDNAERSHPSNFFPKEKLPARYPLYKNKMVCTTCHFPHQKYNINKIQSNQKTGPYFLRADSAGKMFCYCCHKTGFSNFSIDSHAVAIKKAHPSSISFEQKDLIDNSSRECLSCHDGTISINVSTRLVDAGGVSWNHGRSIGMSHPISIDYNEVYLKKSDKYHPIQSLNFRIKLFNGKIGCETCHDHYSKHKNYLVMDNFKSRLCLSCHNL